jgi:hypothetical protein
MADYEFVKKWESNALNYSSVSQFGQNCCALYRRSKPKKYFLTAFLTKSKKQIDNRSKTIRKNCRKFEETNHLSVDEITYKKKLIELPFFDRI